MTFERLRQLGEQADEAPWTAEPSGEGPMQIIVSPGERLAATGFLANATFIVAARNLWEPLVNVAEAARIVVRDFDVVAGPIIEALDELERAVERGGDALAPPPARDGYRPCHSNREEYKMLTKYAIVLERSMEPSSEIGVRFIEPADEDRSPGHTKLLLDPATWQDMGEPDMVTVTVEPGDSLNA